MADNDEIELEQELESDREFDTKISRCFGLLSRKAIKKSDNTFVYAEFANKSDGPFYCPVCLCDAIVRKCSEKVDHFAHSARQSPVIRKKDKELHNKCRDEILELLKQKFPEGKWASEREIPANKDKGFKKVIPDISGRIGDIPVAIEVQLSPYTIRRITEKITEYQKRNPKVAVLYVIPLYDDLGDEPFRPRLFEKFLHSMYYGRVYYWTPNSETKLLPVHFSPAKRWIEETSWFDTDIKEERNEGGFWLTYRTIKKPNYGKPVDITTDFIKEIRKAYEPKNVKKAIPECTIYKDNLKEWWDKKEYKNKEKQFAIFKDRPKPTFIEEYENFDDYDDYDDNFDQYDE